MLRMIASGFQKLWEWWTCVIDFSKDFQSVPSVLSDISLRPVLGGFFMVPASGIESPFLHQILTPHKSCTPELLSFSLSFVRWFMSSSIVSLIMPFHWTHRREIRIFLLFLFFFLLFLFVCSFFQVSSDIFCWIMPFHWTHWPEMQIFVLSISFTWRFVVMNAWELWRGRGVGWGVNDCSHWN